MDKNAVMVLIIILLMISSYYFATNITYNEGKCYYENNDIVLPDMGFKITDDKRDINSIYKIKELMHTLYVGFFIISIFGNKKALYEYLITCSVILFLKNILFVSTILPDPSQKCSKFNLSMPHKGSCYDLVVSSHCILMFVSLFVIMKYELFNKLIMSGCLLVNALVIYFILSLRQHYTMDIINAFAYSYLINYWVSSEIMTNFDF
jgi:membrane-associated phospholipid phosphatase